MSWTHFWDMHSGGSLKEKWHHIFIEAPEPEAKIIFYNRFHHNPDRVTCTCCGQDYSIYTGEDLAQLTGFHRGCRYGDDNKYIEEPDTRYNPNKTLLTVEEFGSSGEALYIHDKDIKAEERCGIVPQQGFVWVD